MLFSQPGVAEFLSGSFECAWESVRPVPRLTLDFGDGRVLERTLRGNIATYVCTSEAETIDLVAGLMDAREYQRRLQQSLRLFERLRAVRAKHPAVGDGRGRGLVSRQHTRWASARLQPEPGKSPLILLQAGQPLGSYQLQTVAQPASVSKFRVEGTLERSLAVASGPDASGLALDTHFAREQGHPLAHAFLAARALQPPSALTRDVYRSLLHVEIDDPYLGLAPNVLGGEPGRH